MRRRGGFAKVRQLAEEQKARLGDGGEYARKLIMKDGETAVVYFSGSVDEPYIIRQHFHPTFKYFYCGGAKCVACAEAAKGNTAYKKGTAVAAFNVIDTRWFHKIPRSSDKERYDYVPCEDDASCTMCRRKIERLRAGKRLGEFALTWGDALGAQEEKIGKKCASCHSGQIRVVEYTCPECTELLDWAPESGEEGGEGDGQLIKCGACRRRVMPVEVIECTKCSKPVRGTIFDFGCPVEITRSGQRKQTSYNFNPIWPPPPVPDWVLAKEMEPFDLEAKYAQMVLSPSAMAEKLQVSNPFDKEERQSVDDNPFEEHQVDASDADVPF